MKAGVVVGFMFFVVASVFLYHPTTTDSKGRSVRGESLMERMGTNRAHEQRMAEPTLYYVPRRLTRQDKVALKATEERRARRLVEQKKLEAISKEIPIINPPTFSQNGPGSNSATYDIGRKCYIATLFADIKESSPTFVNVESSVDGTHFSIIGIIGPTHGYSKVSVHRYARSVRLSVTLNGDGKQFIAISDPHLYGVGVENMKTAR